MSRALVVALWLMVGSAVTFWKLHSWKYLPRMRWTDAPGLALVITLWPILVVF